LSRRIEPFIEWPTCETLASFRSYLASLINVGCRARAHYPFSILLSYQAVNTVRRVHYEQLHKVGTPRVFLPTSPSPFPVPQSIDDTKIYIYRYRKIYLQLYCALHNQPLE